MLLALNIYVLRDTTFKFVVARAPSVFLTGQLQKKGISPDTEKIQRKPVKDASFVNLSHSSQGTGYLEPGDREN